MAGTWTNLEVVLGHQYEVSRSPRRLLKSRVKPVEPSSTSCASITGLATVLAAAPIAAFASLPGALGNALTQPGRCAQSLAVGLSSHGPKWRGATRGGAVAARASPARVYRGGPRTTVDSWVRALPRPQIAPIGAPLSFHASGIDNSVDMMARWVKVGLLYFSGECTSRASSLSANPWLGFRSALALYRVGTGSIQAAAHCLHVSHAPCPPAARYMAPTRQTPPPSPPRSAHGSTSPCSTRPDPPTPSSPLWSTSLARLMLTG